MPSPADVQATFCATLVDEWLRLGLEHAVVAPGSRSTPMALALADRAGAGDLVLHTAHDERTAAFVALGVGLASGRPAAVLCTSGTASTHFHAAVVEAHQAGVPLLVLTADRPPELHGVGAPQTIDQQHLYGAAVRWFADAGVPDAAGAPGWRPFASQALLRTSGTDPGPVHVNLPFREPLVGVAGPLPAVGSEPASERVVPSPGDLDASAEALEGVRGVIVAGRGAGDPGAVHALAEAAGWPVLADPRSGCGHLPAAVHTFDALLREPRFAADHRPEVVLRLGELPASKVLGQWLSASSARQVHVIGRPAVIDPDGVVSHRFVADPSVVCRHLAGRLRGAAGTPWGARWRHAEARARQVLAELLEGSDAPCSEPSTARSVLAALPAGAHLVVASSMPVRDLEWYAAPREHVTVHANRGANGIDGVVATGIGVAAASAAPTAVLLGDVALLHDASSLTGLAERGLDVRIVVVDNDGGGIFSFLPQRAALEPSRFEQLFGTPHGTDLVALARAHGLDAADAVTNGELADQVRRRGPRLVRVRTDRAANVELHDRLHAAVAAAL